MHYTLGSALRTCDKRSGSTPEGIRHPEAGFAWRRGTTPGRYVPAPPGHAAAAKMLASPGNIHRIERQFQTDARNGVDGPAYRGSRYRRWYCSQTARGRGRRGYTVRILLDCLYGSMISII